MNQLVSYAESSSDEEDNLCIIQLSKNELRVDNTNINSQNNAKQYTSSKLTMVKFPNVNNSNEKEVKDLPITDESDDQHCDLEDCTVSEHMKWQIPKSVEKPETRDHKNISSPEIVSFPNTVKKEVNPDLKNNEQVTHSEKVNKQNCDTSVEKAVHKLSTKNEIYNNSGVSSLSGMISSQFHSSFLKVPSSTPVHHATKSENPPHSMVDRKRKLNTKSKMHLRVPDSIHSMFHDKKQKWVDNPADHNNRVRSFPHLEGNWATHVFIPVTRSEQFASFVNSLLKMLMPPQFQVMQDFHVSLSRTVTIRYHWIDPLVESLRENFKCLKSCISDLTSVRLFSNEDKTRTFVCLELCQDDKEFLDYVRAVDKSFAEFRLPSYYENPSFHISVGWCLGDAVTQISDEKLSKAQEMLADFVAANPDLSFVYSQQICCQSGCKSFVITLPDSDR